MRALERHIAGEGWRFNFNNQGGSGYVQFNDALDLDFLPDPLAIGGMWGGVFEDATGQGIVIGSTSGSIIFLNSDGSIGLVIGAGASFTLLGPGATPMLQMTDGSPDLHIPTGGAVVADL